MARASVADPIAHAVLDPVFRIPSYRLHKARGLAVVSLRGRDVYLGPYGSDESKAAYERVIRELTVSRGVDPDQRDRLTVAEFVLIYWRHAQTYYPPGTLGSTIKPALRRLRRHFGETLVKDFGPLRLKALRLALLEERDGKGRRLSRRYINDTIAQVRAFFKWGVGEELVAPTVHQGLAAVDGLRPGRTDAPDPEPIAPVSDEHVEAVLPHLPPVIADMVRVQRLTGMRPGEVCAMTTGELDVTGDIWLYQPRKHKTAHHGKRRTVAIGPRAQEILRPYLKTDPSTPLFSPRRSEEERKLIARQNRKSKVTPSQRKRDASRSAKPKRLYRDRYNTSAYALPIARACQRLGVPQWSPNQLRHTRATELRKQFGLDVAGSVLGHSRLDTTQIYAEQDREKAMEAARKTG